MTQEKIDFKDSDYLENYSDLKKVSDVYKGTKAIQNNQNYLQQFENEDDKKYKERLKHSPFLNYLKPTVDNVANILLRKRPKLDYLSRFENIFKNVDGEGNSIDKFIHLVAKKAVRDGMTFIWTDYPSVSDEIISLLDKETKNIRPYFKQIDRINVLSKKITNINGVSMLSQVVFTQKMEFEVDSFAVEEQDVYVVLQINKGYIFKKSDSGFEAIKEWENNLGYIPFSAVYSNKTGFFKSDIPFLDLTDLNLMLFNKESDLQNIIHLTNVPTLAVYGYKAKKTVDENGNIQSGQVTIGVTNSIMFQDKNTQGMEWISPDGTCIDKSIQNVDRIKKDLDNLSLAVFTKVDFRTATEANLSDKRNNLFLVEIANSIETAIEMSVAAAEDFSGDNYQFSIEFSKDFENTVLDASTIEKLSNMQEKGQISLDTFWTKLRDGEVINIEDYDAEKEKIKSETVEIL